MSKETLLAQIEREVYRTSPEDSDEDMFEYWEKEIEKRLKMKMKENCLDLQCDEIIVID